MARTTEIIITKLTDEIITEEVTWPELDSPELDIEVGDKVRSFGHPRHMEYLEDGTVPDTIGNQRMAVRSFLEGEVVGFVDRGYRAYEIRVIRIVDAHKCKSSNSEEIRVADDLVVHAPVNGIPQIFSSRNTFGVVKL